jgi:hypothetical protein
MNAPAPSSPIRPVLLLKMSTVAKMLDCSIDVVDVLIKSHQLSTVPLSTRSVRVTMASVESFITTKTQTPDGEG